MQTASFVARLARTLTDKYKEYLFFDSVKPGATLAEGLPSVVSRNGLTRAMGGLVAAGLLRRHAGLVPGDRRRVLVSLTLRGKLLARRLVDLMQDGEEV